MSTQLLEVRKDEVRRGDLVYTEVGDWVSFKDIDDDGDVRCENTFGGYEYACGATVIVKRTDARSVLNQVWEDWDGSEVDAFIDKILEAGTFTPNQ